MNATNKATWPAGEKAAIGFAALACLCCLLALLGWIIDSPVLRGFGTAGRPIWPLSILGYTGLSLGFLFAIRGDLGRARLFWAIPLLIAALAIVQDLFGIDLATDQLLFRDGIENYGLPHPGRPVASTTTIFVLLGTAAYFAVSRRWQRDDVASLIASGVLGLATAAGLLILFASPNDPISQFYSIPVPSAVITLSLLLSFVFWQSGFGWVRLLSSDRPASRVLQTVLPAALVLPLAPALLEIASSRNALLSPLGVKLIMLITNIALIGGVVYWAVRRVAREHEALLRSLDALQASEDRLLIATSVHHLGVFEWDVETNQFTWSPGTEQRMGLEPGSLPDFPSWAAMVEPSDLKVVMNDLQRTVEQKAPHFGYRYRFIRPSGGVRVIEGSSRALYDEHGALARTIGVIINVTEQDDRESALRGSEAQLRSILETVPDAMVVIDEDGLIRRFSSAAEKMWNYRASDVIGRDFTMLTPADERERNVAALANYLATGSRSQIGGAIPASAVTAAGRRFPIELRAGIAKIEGKVLFTIFVRDITERLASEERLSELSAELAHVSRLSAMSELAADLAHELNQPLSAATNFLAAARMLIERGADLARIDELMGMASDQTLRAGEIIRRLRAFMARGDVEIGYESVEQTVRDAVELVLVGAGQFHIRILYDFAPDAQMVRADRIQVQQVVVNLVRNAVDVLRNVKAADRQIRISSQRIEGDLVEVKIADTGHGIPDGVLARLFSRFTTTKGESDGMGIGLSISRRIIEAHGGQLRAVNLPEGGAAFCFTLPAAEPEEEE